MTYRRLSRLRQEGTNMNEHLVVAKFGGTSVADASQFRKIKEIVSNNPERRFIVVSAPGKRFPEDRKVTDLLLDCYEKAAALKRVFRTSSQACRSVSHLRMSSSIWSRPFSQIRRGITRQAGENI